MAGLISSCVKFFGVPLNTSMCTPWSLSPNDGATSISTSSTGPQVRDWQNAGVANSAATGLPDESEASSDCEWNGHTGSRVHIGFTPMSFAVVGVATSIIG